MYHDERTRIFSQQSHTALELDVSRMMVRKRNREALGKLRFSKTEKAKIKNIMRAITVVALSILWLDEQEALTNSGPIIQLELRSEISCNSTLVV